MSIKREKRGKIIIDLEKKFKRQRVVFLVGYRGLGTNQMNKLRKEISQSEAEIQVAKKTLIKIAFAGFEKEKFQEEVAVVFGYKDEIDIAKMIYEFSQKDNNLKILGGYLKGDFISDKKVIKLAKLESKERLLEKLVFATKSPIYRFINALNGNTKKLVFVLNAIKKAKEG